MASKFFKCYFDGCDKSYKRKDVLRKHLVNFHKLGKNLNFCCPSCDNSFHNNSSLIEHLIKNHNKSIEKKIFNFSSFEDFMNFKKQEELISGYSFIKNTGDKLLKNKKIIYYNCFRSGKSRLIDFDDHDRNPKSSGTCKINNYCTASMVCSVNLKSNECSVEYVKDHLNHGFDEKHNRLPMLQKEKIADLLENGRSPADVFEFAAFSDDFKVLTLNDIYNVKKKFNVGEPDRLHDDDFISIKLNADKNEDIVGFKNFGEINEEYICLKENDFFLVYMNAFQKNFLLKSLDGPFQCVCMDSTHGMTKYSELKMTTLLTIDEFHEGLGVAFLVSNREDLPVIKLFLKIIKSLVGNLQSKYFMSDGANQYYQAWSSIFDPTTFKLNCSWHINKNWCEKIKSIRCSKKQKIVYKNLKAIQYELKEENFKKLVELFLAKYLNDKDVVKFAKYIRTHYFDNPKKWAYCYRIGSGMTVNTAVESMHKIFKRNICKSRPKGRLDFLITSIKKYSRTSFLKNNTKLIKGKSSLKLSTTFKHHKVALKEFENYEVSSIENSNCYEVTNKIDQSKHEVQIEVQEEHVCRFYCSGCEICVCYAKCDCHVYAIHKELCKHIHLIKILRNDEPEKVFIENPGLIEEKNFSINDDEENNFNANLLNYKIDNIITKLTNIKKNKSINQNNFKFFEETLDDFTNKLKDKNLGANILTCKNKKIDAQVRRQKKNFKKQKTSKQFFTKPSKEETLILYKEANII